MHADLGPPDPAAVGIGAVKGLRAVHLMHHVSAVFVARDADERRGRARASLIFVEPPASEVVRHRQDAGPDPFGHPRPCHEVADLG